MVLLRYSNRINLWKHLFKWLWNIHEVIPMSLSKPRELSLKSILDSHNSQLFLPLAPVKLSLWSYLFRVFYINRIVSYVSFCFLLLSASTFEFSVWKWHVYTLHSFFWPNNLPSWTYHISCTLSISDHLVCFQFGIIKNNYAMSVCVWLCTFPYKDFFLW